MEVCKTTTNLKKKFARKNSMSFFLFYMFKSIKLMDKAKLLESKVKPEERASIQKNTF